MLYPFDLWPSAAAAHIQDRARRIGRFVRQKIENRMRDFIRRAGAFHRQHVAEPLDPVWLAAGGVDLGVDVPGRIALTRTPSVATSRARPSVKVSIAALEAA